VTWRAFEREAGRYEAWYASARGQRADRAEGGLLDWLLERLPEARRILDLGCGTGHFTHRLTARGARVIGLDRSPAMLREARARAGAAALLLADAHRLPLADRAVDLVVAVTALEFLDEPRRALAEAVRVADRGVVVVALNRWSVGGLSRRLGAQRRGALLGRARDRSLGQLHGELREAAGGRMRRMLWRSALLPRPLDGRIVPVPLGDVLGIAVELDHARAVEGPERSGGRAQSASGR
jgi:SAM-dependent methyltransferase